MSPRRLLAGALGSCLALPLLLPGAASAGADTPTTCLGKPVTTTSPVGTEGDDVMVVAISPWITVNGNGGDDTICLVPGGATGGRDPFWFVDAGPGDDVVTNESGHAVTIHLGAGADRYAGGDSIATVHTGAEASTGATSFFAQADDDQDVVTLGTQWDSVYSGDTTTVRENADQITTAEGSNAVFFAGVQGGGGFLDNGGGSGDRIFQVGDWPGEDLTLDLTARTARLDGRVVLAWTNLGSLRLDSYRPRAFTYRGTPGADDVSLADGELVERGHPVRVDVRTGGGDDELTLPGRVSGSISMGRGSDHVTQSPGCRSVVGSPRRLSCTWGSGSARLRSRGVDQWSLHGDVVRFRGTNRGDRVDVTARRGLLEGRAGDDVLGFAGRYGVVDGGPGRDACRARQTRRCERG